MQYTSTVFSLRIAARQRCWQLLLALWIVNSTALAHDSPDHASTTTRQRGRAVLAKIDNFQNSVKEKLKQTLMRPKGESHTHGQSHPSPRSSRYQDIHTVGGRGTKTDWPTQDTARQIGEPEPARHQWIDATPEVNPTQYREILEPTQVTNATPLPEPLRPISRRPITSTPAPLNSSPQPYPLAHETGFSHPDPINSFERDPVISGSRLGQGQVTATEKALNLMRDNEFLRASQNTLSIDNQRLREKLKETQDLLARSNEAIAGASKELQNSDAVNKQLTQRIADLESQHKRYLMDTDRMLKTLRDELDEVLVSEIGQVGN